MHASLSLVFALLAASVGAAPGSKCKKAVCNADNCLRAVRASSAKPFPSVAASDCSSFLGKTVTPCAAITTTTRTVTVTAPAVGVTVTSIVPQTQIETVFETVSTIVETVEFTQTFIQPTEVDVINIIVTAVTVTADGPFKRAADDAVAPYPTPVDLKARVVASGTGVPGTCAATTRSASAVPTYASACSGTARYSSACSCAGYTGSTATLTRATSTATSTSTVTVTPFVTSVLTVPSLVPLTDVVTQLVPATFATTDATLIVQSAFTLTSNIVIPTTVVII